MTAQKSALSPTLFSFPRSFLGPINMDEQRQASAVAKISYLNFFTQSSYAFVRENVSDGTLRSRTNFKFSQTGHIVLCLGKSKKSSSFTSEEKRYTMFSYFIHSTMFRGLRREHYLPLPPSHNKRPPRSKANKSFPEHNKISSSPPIYVQERRYCCLYGINLCSSSTCAPRRPKPPPAQQIKFALGEFPLLLCWLSPSTRPPNELLI